MPDQTSSSSSSGSSGSSSSAKASKKAKGGSAWEEAQKKGVLGETPDTADDDAYTLQGQGEETARHERDDRERLRADAQAASRDPDR